MRVSIRALVSEAVDMLRKGGWQTDDFYEDESAARRRQITQVCSVGAMRLAFRRVFNVDPEVMDEELMRHPAYAEGMRFLGQAVYQLEKSAGYANDRDLEPLLNGDKTNPGTLQPYTTQDVEGKVIDWNDGIVLNYHDPEGQIFRGFAAAVALAPESEQDWPEIQVPVASGSEPDPF